MKAVKQQKSKSVWDKVKQEERDFFFNFLNRKVRGLQKKIKDIAELEDEQKKGEKELKPDQIQKIQNKEEVLKKIAEYENILQVWIEAKKDDASKAQQEILIHQDTITVLLQHLQSNRSSLSLLQQHHESTLELARQLKILISGQNKTQDLPWTGLQVEQKQPENTVENNKVIEPQINATVQDQTPVAPTQAQEHFVLVKVVEKQQIKRNRKESEDGPQQNSHKNSEHFHEKKDQYRGEKKERKESNQINYQEHLTRREEVKQKSQEEEDDGFVTVESKHHKQQNKFHSRKGQREFEEPFEPKRQREPREQRDYKKQKEGRPRRGGRGAEQEIVYVVKE